MAGIASAGVHRSHGETAHGLRMTLRRRCLRSPAGVRRALESRLVVSVFVPTWALCVCIPSDKAALSASSASWEDSTPLSGEAD